ncbi:MAG: hypothetical protein EPO40_37875 [Myxococcaceae bacterium]|nr:MAG: hypothetical protein EPO40_37875 [Myxococcaceae bacterium]
MALTRCPCRSRQRGWRPRAPPTAERRTARTPACSHPGRTAACPPSRTRAATRRPGAEAARGGCAGGRLRSRPAPRRPRTRPSGH